MPQNATLLIPTLEHTNHITFTPREIDILACLLHTKVAKEIANMLPPIKSKTVESHLQNIMKKLGCHSSERIVEIVSDSSLWEYLKKHCLTLLLASEFVRILNKIAKLIRGSPSIYFIEPQDTLKRDLMRGGIQVVQDERQAVDCLIYLRLPQKPPQKRSIVLIQNNDVTNHVPNDDTHIIHWQSWDQDYPLIVFSILKHLLPYLPIDKITAEFKAHWQKIADKIIHKVTEEKSSKQGLINQTLHYIKRHKRAVYTAITLSLGIIGCLCVMQYKSTTTSVDFEGRVRSDLDLPIASQMIMRPTLLKQIDAKIKKRQIIQTVVLLGIGGTGKTILARQYAQKENSKFIWEINAETLQSTRRSFENLGCALAQTIAEKEEIQNIRKIDDAEERIKILLLFIKRKLHKIGPWIFLFDNVDNLKDIHQFFPTDPQAWGYGTILLTTKNQHISDSSYIDQKNVIYMPALTEKEKFTLFCNMINQASLTRDQIKDFLRIIPSFPLDVSIAAHYIKHTKMTCKSYSERLQSGDRAFEKLQTHFLEETSNYTKTRYSIITSALEPLMKDSADYAELLLLVSMIGANNIPVEYISYHKNQAVIDHFIHHMTKHSLMTHKVDGTLFIHRSTQAVILKHLQHTLTDKQIQLYIHAIASALSYSAEKTIEHLDTIKMHHCLEHLIRFRTHESFLDEQSKGLVEAQIGCIHYYLDDFLQAQSYLNTSLAHLTQFYGECSNPNIAKILAYLGVVTRKLGNSKESQRLLQASVDLYRRKFPDEHLGLAWPLLHLGWSYIDINDYEKAKKVLEQSITIYNKQYGGNHPHIAWGLAYLGDVYRMLGYVPKAQDFYEKSLVLCKKLYGEHHSKTLEVSVYLGFLYKYLGKYQQSENILQKLPIIYKKKFPQNHDKIGLSLVYLGDLYRAMGYHKKAENFLKEGLQHCIQCYGVEHTRTAWSMVYLAQLWLDLGKYKEANQLLTGALMIYQKHSYENNRIIAWVERFLANTYKYLKNFEKAERLFKKSLTGFDRHDDNSFVEYGQILRDFGHLYILTKNFEKAEVLLLKGLEILQKNNHPDSYLCLEYLSDLYMEKYKTMNQNKNALLTQAHRYLKQAMNMTMRYFPKESPNIIRIQIKYHRLFSKSFLK